METHIQTEPGRAKRAPGFAELRERATEVSTASLAGGRHVTWALMRGGLLVGLTRTERDVLLSLALWLSPKRLGSGDVTIGVTNERIAADVGVGVRSVQSALAHLEASGWVLRRYTEHNRRYGAGGVDLAPLLARMDQLEAAIEGAEATRHARWAEEQASRSAVDISPRAVDKARPRADRQSQISSLPATDSVLTQIQTPVMGQSPCSLLGEEGVARLGVIPEPEPSWCGPDLDVDPPPLSRPAPRPGRTSGRSGAPPKPQAAPRAYFAPGALAKPPATTAATAYMLGDLEPELDLLVTDKSDHNALMRAVRCLARDLGLPEPILDRAIERKGPLFVAAAVVVTRARKRRGELGNPVGFCRSLLEQDRPADIWRTVYGLRRTVH